jgi:hypothetical protein
MTMNLRTTVIPAALAAVALAAGSVAGAGAQQPLPAHHDPHIADGTLQHKLDSARKKWKAAHVSSYRYEIQVSCFCPPATKPNVFTVRKGVATKYPSGYKSLATVPRLFKTIQGAIDDDVANLNVSYGKRGVPTSIYIDRAYNIADEEAGYTVKRFTPLK